MEELNRLVLIGNGFDLAHGLKTSYKDFLDWYMCNVYNEFSTKSYSDSLVKLDRLYTGLRFYKSPIAPTNLEEVLNRIQMSQNSESLNYNSPFFKEVIEVLSVKNWVDIERLYFSRLKKYFLNSSRQNNKDSVIKLNEEFDFLITQLSKYIEIVNSTIDQKTNFRTTNNSKLSKVFAKHNKISQINFLNFNYTETLFSRHYAEEEDIIHIHGRVADIKRNPIIFGYGYESDPDYQKIEDSGENMYLEHIKSFGYFRTNNYHKLLSYVDSAPYVVYIVGHSCGLSDRVLLNTIFEHKNCERIEIFYHVRNDGTDNFKEITQEISRHFKAQNKDLMRRRLSNKDDGNIIPQNKIN